MCVSHGRICTFLDHCTSQPCTSLWGFRNWARYPGMVSSLSTVGKWGRTEKVSLWRWLFAFGSFRPFRKTRRKLWILPPTRLQFLRVEGRPLVVRSGSPDLKDRLYFPWPGSSFAVTLQEWFSISCEWKDLKDAYCLTRWAEATRPELCDVMEPELQGAGCPKGANGKNGPRHWSVGQPS